ncbi:Ethylmalonyl-CoA decarboxylase [Halotydeus destructor]|nr:Ethylmalonyl-CoA decarboxylase [Halotydeus destructor]
MLAFGIRCCLSRSSRVNTGRTITMSNSLATILNNPDSDADIVTLREEFRKIGNGTFELVKDDSNGIAVLTIDHPERKNSLSGSMMAQFDGVLKELETWNEGKAVVIRGRNGFFCSGGDLTTVEHIKSHTGGRQMGILMQDNLLRLQKLPMISLAVIEGKAIGGGAEVATACDFRVMTPKAEIGFVHIRLNITAGWGGGSRLVKIIGPSKALQMMSTGDRLSAKKAHEFGLVDAILDADETNPEDVLAEAKNWLSRYTTGHVTALRAAKKIVSDATFLPLSEALNAELNHSASVWGGSAHKEGLEQECETQMIC